MARERWSAPLLGEGPLLLGPQTSTWFPVGAQTTDISMGFGGNMATDINTALGYTRKDLSHCTEHGPPTCHMLPTTAACPPLSSSKAQGHHQDLQGIQQRHRVHTPTRISGFIPAWGSNRDHRCQHGFQWHPDHGVLQGGPIQNLSPSQASITGQSQADPEAVSVLLTLLCNDSPPVSVLSLTCHHHCVSSSPALHSTPWSIFPSSLLSSTSLIIVGSTRQGQRSQIL